MRPSPRIDIVRPLDLPDQPPFQQLFQVAVEWARLEIDVPGGYLAHPLHDAVPVQVALCQREKYMEERGLQREKRCHILFCHFIPMYSMDMYEMDI